MHDSLRFRDRFRYNSKSITKPETEHIQDQYLDRYVFSIGSRTGNDSESAIRDDRNGLLVSFFVWSLTVGD